MIWMPDIEILNLKQFSTLDVLSKLEGLWLNRELELIYAVACRITWICPMTFDSFPLDVQVDHGSGREYRIKGQLWTFLLGGFKQVY